MSDPSAIPVRRIYDARQAKAKTKTEGENPSTLPSVSPAGPRKLIRPRLPEGVAAVRYPTRVAAISSRPTNHYRYDPAAESSHAEAFYLQKQIHSKTLMTFVLDDGEQISGTIEWYDRNAIKIRQGGVRTLIYKPSIKYLYKSADNSRV
jgi:sRNA-binding regulator protein Hfq